MYAMPVNPEALWSISTTAHYLAKSTKTLKNWMERAYGPPVYKVGGEYRYDPTEVRDWLREQSVGIPQATIAKVLASGGAS